MTLLTTGLLIIIAGLLMVIGCLAMEMARLTGEQPARARLRNAEDRLSALLRRRPALPASPVQRRAVTAPSVLPGRIDVPDSAVAMYADGGPYLAVPPEPVQAHVQQPIEAAAWDAAVRGRHARTTPKQPWDTASFAAAPAGELPPASDPGDGLVPVPLVPAYAPQPAGVLPTPEQQYAEYWRPYDARFGTPVHGQAPVARVLESQRLTEARGL